ncbi:ABC transporter ATP-binding protein/permease [[Clostridium] innocuum]|nr:ABC transporter ATP-binding protein/permease [[Clostridium] innocuum]MCR0579058.1 ABC transporter ATP-binding protein/permease [[Clostridium] innocuum]
MDVNAWQEIKKFTGIVRLSNPHIVWIWSGYGITNALSPFITLYYSAEILNQLIVKEYTAAFQTALLMCTGVLICSLLAKAFYNRLQVICRTAVQRIDQKLLYKAMRMEYELMETQETMDTLRRTRNSSNGSGKIDSAIEYFAICCSSLCTILLALLALGTLMLQIRTWDIYLLLLLAVLAVFLIFKNAFAKKHGALLEKLCNENDHNNALVNYLWSLFYRMETAKEIRLYHMDTLFEVKNEKLMQDPAFRSFGKDNGKLLFQSDLLGQVLSFSAYIYVATLAMRSIISIGQVLYMAGIILKAVDAIAQFQVDYAQLRHQLSYLNAFYDFLHLPNMHYDGTLPIEKRDDGEYEFEFRHVSFRYPQQTNDVLHDVNIRFRLKEKLAIVGMNGAGKTTIVKLLCRLYDPSEGEILLNGINIQKYDYAEYTSIFSVVFQDFALFSYPLDENIAGASAPNAKRITSVLQRLDIWERIKSFTDQEHSLLFTDYANGVNVSGGEAQKLAIARALYKDAPFVILDEPTAALDPLSEAEIYEHFDMLVQGKTTLYISHRMSSCKFCDRIIVMEQGKVEEEGTHDTLLKENGVYAQLWNAQAEYYSE